MEFQATCLESSDEQYDYKMEGSHDKGWTLTRKEDPVHWDYCNTVEIACKNKKTGKHSWELSIDSMDITPIIFFGIDDVTNFLNKDI